MFVLLATKKQSAIDDRSNDHKHCQNCFLSSGSQSKKKLHHWVQFQTGTTPQREILCQEKKWKRLSKFLEPVSERMIDANTGTFSRRSASRASRSPLFVVALEDAEHECDVSSSERRGGFSVLCIFFCHLKLFVFKIFIPCFCNLEIQDFKLHSRAAQNRTCFIKFSCQSRFSLKPVLVEMMSANY